MSKRKRKNRKSGLGSADNMLARLHEMAGSGDPNAVKAKSLVDWRMRYGDWTQKQYGLVRWLLSCDKTKKKKPKRKYYLYAIRAGEHVKLGFSCDVRKRMKALQTSQPITLQCIWRYYVGENMQVAKAQEKKLHRYCMGHKVRSEWFDAGCIPLVLEFAASHK